MFAAAAILALLICVSAGAPTSNSSLCFGHEQEESGEWLRSSRGTAASVTPPRSQISLSPAPGSLVDSLRANLAAATATATPQPQRSPPAQHQQQQRVQQGADQQGAEAAPGARRRPGSPPMIQLDSTDDSGGAGGDPFPGQPCTGNESAADATSPKATGSTADSATAAGKAPSASTVHGISAVPADLTAHSNGVAPSGGAGDGSPPATAPRAEPAAGVGENPPPPPLSPPPPQPALRGSVGPRGHELADDASSVADNPFEVLQGFQSCARSLEQRPALVCSCLCRLSSRTGDSAE
jgi:hypothetical protein